MKKLEPGMIVRHRDSEDIPEFYWVATSDKTIRPLGSRTCTTCSVEEQVLVGRLPPNELDATKWDGRYKLPILKPLPPASCFEVLADNTVLPNPKEKSSMFKFLKWSGKWASIFVLFSAISNPTSVWEAARDWWTAPTALELGDWVKVRTCDSCNKAVDEETMLCPKCGEEKFSEKKGQSLWEPTLANIDAEDKAWSIRGYVYEDGSTSLVPGHWIIPEREVEL